VVGKRDSATCSDSEGRRDQYKILTIFQRAAAGETNHQFSEAMQVLDEAFGAEGWRAGQGMFLLIHAD
jgi:hypothetical protein